MTTNGEGSVGLTRRQLLLGGGMLLVCGGLGAASWRGGSLQSPWRSGSERGLDASEFAAMGTYLTVTSPTGDGAAAVRAAVEAVGRVERRMSFFVADSEIGRLNRSRPGSGIELSPELAGVLTEAGRVHRLSGGAFDPTVPPLLKTWGFRAGAPTHLPDRSEVREALGRTGFDRVEIDGGALVFHEEAMSIDLGGIAKGHAVDRAAAAMVAAGTVGLVNSGGDIRAAGKHPDEDAWTIGVRDPIGGEEVFATMPLAGDRAVATSGTYEQYVEVEGRRIPHVLDPRSGEPVDEVVSATVTADTAVFADALATACVVLGAADALKLLDRLPEVEGLLVARRRGRHRIEATSGFDGRILLSV